jgi:SWI/SNF-related matrix-associated actin-dependent regulator of chromatin subfamily A member 5
MLYVSSTRSFGLSCYGESNLEDYLRLVGHEYCRIDGNTDGKSRDLQMEVFNELGSSKFCFLLSTRAGRLGINLETANIVIL